MSIALPAEARVTRIVSDTTVSPAFGGQSFGTAGQYETLAGRAFGELDPNDPHNSIITDINLAPRNASGRVEYTAAFLLVKPIDMSRSSHLLWEDVPNRGGRITIGTFDRNNGDVGLSAGWQGDNSGATVQTPAEANTNDFAIVPVAVNSDGSPVTGRVLGRFRTWSGANSQPIIVYTQPCLTWPLTLDTTQATLDARFRKHRRLRHRCANGDSQRRLGVGELQLRESVSRDAELDADLSAQRLRYHPAVPARVHGERSVRARHRLRRFPRHGQLFQKRHAGRRRYSKSGRERYRLGHRPRRFAIRQLSAQPDASRFYAGRSRRKVYDAIWPTIAGGRLPLNVRFGLPDAAARLYDPARETPTWWVDWPDPLRGQGPAGILDRCIASNTCPKVVESFGSTEFWYLKIGTSLAGVLGDADIPLTRSIRRYYIPSTTHGEAVVASARRHPLAQRQRHELGLVHVSRKPGAAHRDAQRDHERIARVGD
jgi:hypothetical protein